MNLIKISQLSALSFLLASTSCSGELQNADFVIPKPQQVIELEGRGCDVDTVTDHLLCEIDSSVTPASSQGYILEICPEGSIVKARSQAGLFYGKQTLNQIVRDAKEAGRKIKPMTITDWPDMEVRGIHIGYWFQIEKKEYLYRLIDKLAEYKLNTFFFEIEDKLKYESHPELSSSLALSKQEMQDLCEYAHERFVEIEPLVQGLAHAFYILKHHPELRESQNDLFDCCPSNPATYDLLFDLYDEAMEAMPYCRYVHVGGDEVEKIGLCPRCKKTGKSAYELNMDWMWKVTEHIKSKGKIPVIWDDMPLRHAGMIDVVNGNDSQSEVDSLWNPGMLEETISLFPKGCEYVRWRYDESDKPGIRKILDWYEKNGMSVLAATAADNGAQKYMPRQTSRLPYIKEFSALTKEYSLKGIISTYWQDKGAITEFALRGFIGQGEFGWNACGRSVKEFCEAHAKREFGFEPEDSLMSFLTELEKSMDFLDTAVVYVHGKKKTPIELPDSRYPGEWSKRHGGRLALAEYWESRYDFIEQGIESAIAKARRNDYTLRMYRENNHHQHFDVELLLALKRYDLADSREERGKALLEIQKVCDGFETMRKNLEAVFSESCVLDMPEDYILINWGVLPSISKDFSWNYHYEIPMVENVRKWVKEQKEAEFKMIIRSWTYSAQDHDLLKREIVQFKKYPVFDEMWMFLIDTTIGPGVKKVSDALRECGIRPGFEQLTLGHGDPSERKNLNYLYGQYCVGSDPYNIRKTRCMVGPDGTTCKTQACPRSEVFLKYISDYNAYFARKIQPDRVMIDDDLRLYNHKPIDAACFCDFCISEFNKAYSYDFTRSNLVASLENPGCEQIRKDWVEFGQDALGHIAGNIARAVIKESPNTDVGLENGCNTMVPITGIHLNPVLDSLYSVTGVQPSYRPGAGFYRDYEPRGMITKANDLARQIRLLPDYVKSIPAEIEGYHHTASGKSPHSLELESFLYLAMGCTQLSYAISSSMDEPVEWYADTYYKTLLPIKEKLKEYAEFNSGTEPGGLDEFISPDWYLRTENFFQRFTPDSYIARFQSLGLPFTPGGHYACARMMTGSELKVCAPGDLEHILGGGLIMDEEAFGILPKDGLTQVNDLEGTRMVRTFATKQGGRLAVIPTFKPTNINISRRDELIRIADWASFGKLPVIAQTMAQVMFVPRVEYSGKLRSVLALNCTISDYGPITVKLRGCCGARKFVWKTPGKPDRKLKAVFANNEVILTIPGIEDWSIGWIAVNY